MRRFVASTRHELAALLAVLIAFGPGAPNSVIVTLAILAPVSQPLLGAASPPAGVSAEVADADGAPERPVTGSGTSLPGKQLTSASEPQWRRSRGEPAGRVEAQGASRLRRSPGDAEGAPPLAIGPLPRANPDQQLGSPLPAAAGSQVASIPPSDLVASFQGSGSGMVECSGPWGYQRITYNLDVAFDVEAANPNQTGALLSYGLKSKVGTVHFYGTAEDQFWGETTILNFDRFQSIDIQGTSGTFEISTDQCNDAYIGFPVPPSSSLPYAKYIEFSDLFDIVRDTVEMPYPWNEGVTCLDNNYGVPGTLTSLVPSVCEDIDFEILDAKMVSPSELGIGVRVRFPDHAPPDAPRKVRFSATINGKDIEVTIDISKYTMPGEWWGPGVQNEMYDINGNLSPTTPLRIDFQEPTLGINRFAKTENFELFGVAFWEDGAESEQRSIDVMIPLPVVVLHGYIHPYGYPFPAWQGGNFFPYELAYKGFSEFLKARGYGNENEWAEWQWPALQALGYPTAQYRTLWDPSDFIYTNPWIADPNTIESDVEGLLNAEVWTHTYADKINIIGHSFGGLVGRFYASVKPENVNMVITAGTPHQGTTRFYRIAFEKYESRAEAEAALGSGIINWTVPKYSSLLKYPGDPVSLGPPFESTFTYGPGQDVRYYALYSTYHDTERHLYLKDKGVDWYQIDYGYTDEANRIVNGIGYDDGDNYMLWQSAGGFGIPLPLSSQADSGHSVLLSGDEAQRTIYALLSEGAVSTEAAGNNSSRYFGGEIPPLGVVSEVIGVNPGVVEAEFEVSWEGSDIDLVLVDPSGQEIDREFAAGSPEITFTGWGTGEKYRILNPGSGNWTIEIRAVDVPPEGEEYVAFAHLLTKLAPIARAGGHYVGSKGIAILFDASGSDDPDGGIVSYEWDWDHDGVYDEMTESAIVMHTWDSGFEGPVYLRVTDTDGLTSTDIATVEIDDNCPPAAVPRPSTSENP